MQEAGEALSDITNQARKKPGRKSLNLSPEEKKQHHAKWKKEYREKKKKAKEEYLKTPEGQAADR